MASAWLSHKRACMIVFNHTYSLNNRHSSCFTSSLFLCISRKQESPKWCIVSLVEPNYSWAWVEKLGGWEPLTLEIWVCEGKFWQLEELKITWKLRRNVSNLAYFLGNKNFLQPCPRATKQCISFCRILNLIYCTLKAWSSNVELHSILCT